MGSNRKTNKFYGIKNKMYILIYESPVVITGGIKTQRPNRPRERTINTEAL